MSYAEVSGEGTGRTVVEIRFVGGNERVLRLKGSEADAFLKALPVYLPADED